MNTFGNNPLDALFRPPVLIAVVLAGEALALIMALGSESTGIGLVQFGLASLGVQWVALGTLCSVYLLRRPLAKLPSSTVAWTCLAIQLFMTLLVTSAAWRVFEVSANPIGGQMSFLMRMLAISVVVGLVTLLVYQNYWRARQLAVRAKQLELESLRARIQPHFLFNTLNTAVALVHARPDEAERVLLDLADLFRAALRGSELVPLEKELELTRNYLEIESLRLGPRLQVSWRLPETLPDIAVPALSLQPLAENAIRHGIEHLATGGCIDIRLERQPEWVLIRLENDVPGDFAGSTEKHGIGLASSRERIKAMTEGRGSVETKLLDHRHVATVRLPAR